MTSPTGEDSGVDDQRQTRSESNNVFVFGRDGRLTFIEVFLALVLGWILVSLWQRVIENFAFGTLGLNRTSSLHALIVAAGATVIFIVFTFVATDLDGEGRDVSEIIEEDIVSGIGG